MHRLELRYLEVLSANRGIRVCKVHATLASHLSMSRIIASSMKDLLVCAFRSWADGHQLGCLQTSAYSLGSPLHSVQLTSSNRSTSWAVRYG